MAYLFKRERSKFWWVGFTDGGHARQRSLKVTSKKSAELLLAEYLLLEAKNYNNESQTLIIKKSIADLFDEFITNRSGRQRTKEWYLYCKKNFEAFCSLKNIKDVADITMTCVEEFYTSRKERLSIDPAKKNKPTPEAARSNLRALRAFLNYAVEKGYIRVNPALRVKVDKNAKKIFRALTMDEISNLLASAEKVCPKYHPLMATAFYAGLRAGELLHLEPRDIDFISNTIIVRSKAENKIKDHQERQIPLNSKLKKILLRVKPEGRWLFFKGNAATKHRKLNRQIVRVAGTAGMDKRDLSVQVLREAFGSQLRYKGVDIALISQYLGHSSIDVTLRHYAHISISTTHKEIDLL